MTRKRIFIILSTLGITASAYAGLKIDAPVAIDYWYEMAQGSLSSARSSNNTKEFIECSLDINGVTCGVFCYARDAAGNNAYCTSTDPRFVKTVQSINESSRLEFSWDSSNSNLCTSIVVDSGSLYLP
jgi:hypothetical protein